MSVHPMEGGGEFLDARHPRDLPLIEDDPNVLNTLLDFKDQEYEATYRAHCISTGRDVLSLMLTIFACVSVIIFIWTVVEGFSLTYLIACVQMFVVALVAYSSAEKGLHNVLIWTTYAPVLVLLIVLLATNCDIEVEALCSDVKLNGFVPGVLSLQVCLCPFLLVSLIGCPWTPVITLNSVYVIFLAALAGSASPTKGLFGVSALAFGHCIISLLTYKLEYRKRIQWWMLVDSRIKESGARSTNPNGAAGQLAAVDGKAHGSGTAALLGAAAAAAPLKSSQIETSPTAPSGAPPGEEQAAPPAEEHSSSEEDATDSDDEDGSAVESVNYDGNNSPGDQEEGGAGQGVKVSLFDKSKFGFADVVKTGIKTERVNRAVDQAMKKFDSLRPWPAGVVAPNNPLVMRFQLFMAVLIIYSVIVVPFRIAFDAGTIKNSFGYFMEWFFDFMFLCDIILAFNTALETDSGEYDTDRWRIAKSYLKMWFWIDTISTFPFQLLEGMASGGSTKLLRILRLFKLGKLTRVAKLKKTMDLITTEYPEMQVLLQLTSMVMILLFMTHLVACFWYLVASSYYDYYKDPNLAPLGNPYNGSSWIMVQSISYPNGSVVIVKDADQWSKYIMSVYWTMTTMTTLGYGDITPQNPNEVGMAMVVMLMGAIVFAYIIGSITTIFDQMNIDEIKIKQKRDEVSDFCTLKELPPKLTKRVKQQVNHQIRVQNVYAEADLLNSLPADLKGQLIQTIIKQDIDPHNNIKMFNIDNISFVNELFLALKPVTYIDGETVIERGSVVTEIVFLTKGRMAMCDPQGNIHRLLSKGSAVSNAAAIKKVPQHATVFAQSKCEAMNLPCSKLEEVRAINSDLEKTLDDIANAIMVEDQNLWARVKEYERFNRLLIMSPNSTKSMHTDLEKGPAERNPDLIKRNFIEHKSTLQRQRTLDAISSSDAAGGGGVGGGMEMVAEAGEDGVAAAGTTTGADDGASETQLVDPSSPPQRSSSVSLMSETDLLAMDRQHDSDSDHDMDGEVSVNTCIEGRCNEKTCVPLLHPEARPTFVWDMCVMVCIIYSVIFVPLGFCFSKFPGEYLGVANYVRYGSAFYIHSGWAACNFVVDLFFYVDILVTFNKAFQDENLKIVDDRKVIAMTYLRGFFLIDLVSTLPMGYFLDSAFAGMMNGQIFSLLRLLRMIRLLKLLRLLKSLKFLKQLEEDEIVDPGVIRAVKYFIMLFIIGHFVGCLSWYIAESNPNRLTGQATWIGAYNLGSQAIEDAEWSMQYLVTIYWSFTLLTTVGYGDILPQNDAEMVYHTFAMLVGAVVFSMIIANVTTIFEDLERQTKRKTEELAVLSGYMTFRGVSSAQLKKYRRSWVEQSDNKRINADEFSLMDTLSSSLRNDIIKHVMRDLLEAVEGNNQFLADKDALFVMEFGRRCRRQTLLANQVLFDKGTIGDNQIYIVIHGACCAFDPDGRAKEGGGPAEKTEIMTKGEFFAEDEFANNDADVAHKNSVRAWHKFEKTTVLSMPLIVYLTIAIENPLLEDQCTELLKFLFRNGKCRMLHDPKRGDVWKEVLDDMDAAGDAHHGADGGGGGPKKPKKKKKKAKK